MNIVKTRFAALSTKARWISAAIAAFCLVTPGVARDRSDISHDLDAGLGVSSADHAYRLEELCRSALELSPKIREQEYRVQSQRSNIVLRRNDLLPEINLNVNQTDSGTTDLRRGGARIFWRTNLSELFLRDLRLAHLGLMSAQEYLRRERVWVLNDVANKYRNIAVLQMREETYRRVIAVTRSLDSDEPGFDVERDLKIDEYTTELTRIRNRFVDVTSQLSALAFGDAYGSGLRIDPSSVRYLEIPIDAKAVVRRTIKERMRPDVLNFRKAEIKVKTATRRYQPSIDLSVERWRVDGVAGQGFTSDDTTIKAGINLLVNPFSSRAAHGKAIAEVNVAKAEALVELNDLINSTKRSLDRFFQARENLLGHYEKYGDEPVDFYAGLQEVFGLDLERLDRQVITTLDLLLNNDVKRIEYLSDYISALVVLNFHVMVTPLTLNEYAALDPDNTMPPIFEHLSLPRFTYERHRKELISP